jgi:hypothetical protein
LKDINVKTIAVFLSPMYRQENQGAEVRFSAPGHMGSNMRGFWICLIARNF